MHRTAHTHRHRPRAAIPTARRAAALLPSRALALALALALTLVAAAPASAHILNEKTQFPDIEFVEARLDIVMLVGAGLIPQTPVFLPEDPLSSKDLATWAALAHGLGRGGETPDVDALAQAALAEGFVASLDEQATYDDINRLLFDGAVPVPDDLAGAVPTRAEAAAFVAQHLFDDAGLALLERLGVRPGPTGTVDAVRVNEVAPGDHHGARYSFVFGETAYDVDAHGRVGNGPVDLLQWEGAYVVRSLIQGDGDEAVLTYVEAGEPGQAPGEDEATGQPGEESQDPADEAEEAIADDPGAGPAQPETEGAEAAAEAEAGGPGLPLWLWILVVAAIVALGGFLFAGGRRRS